MRSYIMISAIACLLYTQLYALDDSNAVRLYVISDSLQVHKEPSETSEVVVSFSKGDFMFYQERFGEDETFAHIDGHTWLYLVWTLGSGWARQSSLLDGYLWKEILRIPQESLTTEKKLENWLTNTEQAGFESNIITVSPDKESIIAAIGTSNNYGGYPCHFLVGKGLVSRLDADEWMQPLWSKDSRYLAGEPQIPPDGWFDMPLSIYDTETGETTFIAYCQYISQVEFYEGFLIWLGFEEDIGKVMPWDYLTYDFSQERIYPTLWAYNLDTAERIRLLEALKSSISTDEKGHYQATLKPEATYPIDLKNSNLYKKYNGKNALLWFDTLE